MKPKEITELGIYKEYLNNNIYKGMVAITTMNAKGLRMINFYQNNEESFYTFNGLNSYTYELVATTNNPQKTHPHFFI